MSYKDYIKKKKDYSGVLRDSSEREIKVNQTKQAQINKPLVTNESQNSTEYIGNRNAVGGEGGGGSRGASNTGNTKVDRVRDAMWNRVLEKTKNSNPYAKTGQELRR